MSLAFATDLYELTMAQSYLDNGKTKPAVFSLFVRKLPKNRNFLVSAGLENLLERIRKFKFTNEELSYLANLHFSKDFISYLKNYKFSGDIYAIDEGRVVFENEPLIQVEASLPDAQILETLVINAVHFQTLVASKAARSYLVSNGKRLVDFGLRRAHGIEAGLYATRSAYIGGFSSTSNLMAGKMFGIPVVGTMAHSYIVVFDSEEEAFKSFAKSFPENSVFIIDTYDTLSAANTVVKLFKNRTSTVAVRIDSGDLCALSRSVRKILDDAGLNHVKIIASGGLDEYDIQRLLGEDAPIDVFAVGTMLVTSSDSSYLDMAYKIVEYDGKPKFKLSPGKATFPYKRQIARHYSQNGIMSNDESIRHGVNSDGEELVTKIVENGKIIRSLPNLGQVRETFFKDVARLPENLKTLEASSQRYKVYIHD
ncbi:MAG: nicotinate phosphoribosyltransferase [Candidatus Bathyarchaeota archaeon]